MIGVGEGKPNNMVAVIEQTFHDLANYLILFGSTHEGICYIFVELSIFYLF